MAGYCTSVRPYFHEPQASENTAQECSTKFACTANPWQRDFELVCSLAGYSFFYRRAGFVRLKKEARVKLRCESIQ